MASYVTPLIHATNDVFSVVDNNTLAGNEVFLYQRPYILASQTIVQSLPGVTTTQMTLGAATSGYGFSLSSNNAVVPLTGLYHVDASGAMAANGNANACEINLFHNGTVTLYGSAVTPTTIAVASTASGLILCSAGDTIGLYMFNGIAGAANSSIAQTYLHISFVGSQ